MAKQRITSLAQPLFALVCMLVPGLGLVWSARAHADIPALSREFRTERYISTPRELESIRAQRRIVVAVSGGAFVLGDDFGQANPFGSGKRVGGGTIAALAQLGRYTVGADGIADTRRNVDVREFEQRVYASAYAPEAHASMWAAAGFEHGEYAGVEATAEMLATRWEAVTRSTDLRPRVWLWARARHLDGQDQTVLTPAAALFIQHVVVFGSQFYAGVSAQSDVAAERLPSSIAMIQSGFASVPRPLRGGGTDPDAPGANPSRLNWNWFTAFAYALPLDDRGRGRLVGQFGLRFLLPFGR